ncbi:hypothetical protein [Microbacterium sp. 18062]|uniref:hypothetical protein n=1 Tax=Microbacterium sp. 18062 TaxID=2681410 RepID=UPI00135CD882|nr:hypothetical protein [Microbacterium sp. 18062]
MTLQRMSPRVEPVGEASVPVFPNGRSPRPLAWLVIAFALLPASLAFVDDRVGFRLVMGALALTILTVGVGLHVMLGAVEPRVVSIDAAARALRFAPSAAATAPTLVMAFALLLPALAQLVVDVAALPTMPASFLLSRGPYALGALGVVILAVRLWQTRVPAGLELSPEGLRGIRGRARVEWRWEDLAEAGVVAGPAAKLSLVSRGGTGSPVLAPAIALGSDPNQVAAIVRYYLERPAERTVLADGGIAAVRRVEDALRERTT